ncbi:hypothetical protein KOR34_29530 [Posidoniimonas corsicana]|uniref:Uncharacterized protein n=1 Tax=Posidoniimonas corsicana TaxID=1938618 RepID=A0A5C5VJ45_9BACT|nr:hypothetical protein KOR34_29530 [Posidoniimonas corsicana]
MAYRIENCDWAFEFQCPLGWERLVKTDKNGVRVCDVCLKEVIRCSNDAEIGEHAAMGHCVAISVGESDDEETGEYFLGLILPVDD